MLATMRIISRKSEGDAVISTGTEDLVGVGQHRVYRATAAGIDATKVMTKSKPTTNAVLIRGFTSTPFQLTR
jgi:hypothetical protein